MDNDPRNRTEAELRADRACCLRSPEQVQENIAAIQRLGRRFSYLLVHHADAITMARQRHHEVKLDGTFDPEAYAEAMKIKTPAAIIQGEIPF